MSDCTQLFQQRHTLQTLLQHVVGDDARQNLLDQLADVNAQIQAQGCVEPAPPPPPVLHSHMTPFQPKIEGFAFMNDWKFDDTEKATILRFFQAAVGPAVALLLPFLTPAIGVQDVLLAPFGVPPGTAEAAEASLLAAGVTGKLNGVLSGLLSQEFHLCGGMAYAARDYYKANLIIQRGFSDVPDSPGQPDRNTPEGSTLRNYIMQRMVDTFTAGGAATKTLEWMGVLHFVPPELKGGAPKLLEWTKDEWGKLKQYLEADEPWPIGIVGGTTLDPTQNHQILAIGYDETAVGGTIYVYDNSFPDSVNTIKFDWTGSELNATESAHLGTGGFNPKRGPLKGFFCDEYTFSSPPVGIGITQSPTVTPPGPYGPGQQVMVTYTATNVGYGDSPDLKLYVRALQQPLIPGLPAPILPSGEYIDFTSPTESAATIKCRLSNQAPHDVVSTNTTSRQLAQPAELNIPQPGEWSFLAEAWLAHPDGGGSYKFLPLVQQKGKESKEGKDGKEKEKEASKDRKDNKETAKEKDRDAVGFAGTTHMSGPGGAALSRCYQNNEPPLATGQAFIRPEERPDVGR